MVRVQFLFDFGSPNAYLSHKVIPAIGERTGVAFDYVPILLGGVFKLTGNQPPAVAFGGVKNKLAYEQLEIRRFVARHGLSQFRMNPHFPVNTLQLMRGAVAAQAAGVFEPYVEAVFADMWERGRKMDAAEELLRLSQTDEVKAGLMANTQAAVDKGVFGSPSFLVGEELFFGKDRLGEVENEIRAQQAA
jgi:2-hydroxychromene-2-carboxylate isomerase